jgi:hypothetical protein
MKQASTPRAATVPLNIIESIDDPQLFAPFFRKREGWKAWRTFLAALFGIPLDGNQHRVFKQ